MAEYKMPDWVSGAINASLLNEGNALSFSEQPFLSELFQAVLDDSWDITFVVGAGFSIDGGFPTWSELLDRLVASIQDDTTRALAEQDGSDPMRRAETILRLLAPSGTSSDAERVREALYRDVEETNPGPLAEALVTVALALGKRCRLVTTNFDDVLEVALEAQGGEEKPEAFSLDLLDAGPGATEVVQEQNWDARRGEIGPRAVLHLHGMLRRHLSSLEPVVLTESTFLQHGPRARSLVAHLLRTTCVVFVGVSLTDPNLVGPLWDTHDGGSAGDAERPPCFVVHVPGMAKGARDIQESRVYELQKYQYLEEALGVRPVFLKSYSQLHQMLIEIGLAMQVGTDYFAGYSYGQRFTVALDRAYASLGSPDAGEWVAPEEARRVSDALQIALDPGGGLGSVLRLETNFRERRRLRGLKREFGDGAADDERFGLFLWLRSRSQYSGEPADYGLTLMASSTYVHREPWSFVRRAAVEPNSGLQVAECLWSNSVIFQNLPEVSRFPLWRGTVCMPVRLIEQLEVGSRSVESSLTIGAIALNTTHHIFPDEADAPRVSSIAAILQDQALIGDLLVSLQDAALSVLSSNQRSAM